MTQRPAPPDPPDPLLALFSDGSTLTRAEVGDRSGYARSTIGPRLDALVERGFLRPMRGTEVTGGRRHTAFALDPANYATLALDVTPHHSRIAVVDLGRHIIADRVIPGALDDDPERTFRGLAAEVSSLLDEVDPPPLVGVGVSLPAPVDPTTGRPVRPPSTPGWHGFDVAAVFREVTGARVTVDRNLNMMALAELTMDPRLNSDMIFIDVSTWIGAGVVVGGRLIRGSIGQVGHIGHVVAEWEERDRCSCGRYGCLEAVAGGAALLRRFGERFNVTTTQQLVDLANGGEAELREAIRASGQKVGTAAAMYSSVMNPGQIVISGSMSHAGLELLKGVRESVYSTTFPTAAERLVVRLSEAGDDAAVLGASVMAVERYVAHGSNV